MNPKAQAVNMAQRQLRPEPYFPEVFKSWALRSKQRYSTALDLNLNCDPSIEGFLEGVRLQMGGSGVNLIIATI